MSAVSPYLPRALTPARPSRQTRQTLALVDDHELVACRQVAAVVRVTASALVGTAAIIETAGTLSARDPLAADALNHVALRGVNRIGAIVDSA